MTNSSSSGPLSKTPPNLGSFRFWAVAASALCFLLAAVWLVRPQLLISIWRLQTGPTALVLARRSAALFAGIGIMFWLARAEPPSPARNALSVGLAAGCLVLAGLGIADWANGQVGSGIFLAVLTELALAVGIIASRRA